MEPSRRGFLAGLTAFFAAAPLIVRSTSLMPVRSLIVPVPQTIVPVEVLPPESDLVAELAAITRKAFMPRLYVQLWKSQPLMEAIHSGELV